MLWKLISVSLQDHDESTRHLSTTWRSVPDMSDNYLQLRVDPVGDQTLDDLAKEYVVGIERHMLLTHE